jgi:phosphatidylglycerophosphate synthase
MGLKEALEARMLKKASGAPFEYIYRPISGTLARWLLPTRVTPNQVTYLRVVPILVASYCFYLGDVVSYLLAALCIFLWDVLDHLDGDLARLRGQTSDYGAFLETYLDRSLGRLAGLPGFAIAASFGGEPQALRVWFAFALLLFGEGMKTTLQEAARGYQSRRGDAWASDFNQPKAGIFYRAARALLYWELQIVGIAAVLFLPFGVITGFNSLYLAILGYAVLNNVYWIGLGAYTAFRLRHAGRSVAEPAGSGQTSLAPTELGGP